MLRSAWGAARLVLSIAFLIYLLDNLNESDPETFARLRTGTLNQSFLFAAFACSIAEAVFGGVRWWISCRLYGLRYPLGFVVRLEFLAITINFLGVGPLGGDVARALLLVGGDRRRIPTALASVFTERILGLQSLITLLATTSLATKHIPEPLWSSYWPIVAVGFAGPILLIVLLVADWPWRLAHAGLAAGPLARPYSLVAGAAVRCRENRPAVLAIACVSASLQLLQIVCAYSFAHALPGPAPTLSEMSVILPTGMLSFLVPLPFGALGLFDLTVSSLYEPITAGRVPAGQGLLMVMLMRAAGAVIAAAGLGLYRQNRQRLAELAAEE